MIYKTVNKPIYLASTLLFKNFKEIKKNHFTYGTHGSPNTIELEKKIKKIEKGKYCILTNSGLNSIFVSYFSLIKKGSKILFSDNIYNPNYRILKYFKKIDIKCYKCPCDSKLSYLKKKFYKKKINIIFLEMPGSITFKTPNLNEFVKFSKINNSLIIVDNTFSAGIGFSPLKKKVDISIQALTKYQSGKNDIIMGSITTNNKKIYKKIKNCVRIMGICVNSFDCYIMEKRINDLKYKYKKKSKKLKKIISKIKKKKNIKILHPSLKSCEGNKNFNKLFKYYGGLFTIRFSKKKKRKVLKFINNLKIFKIGYSWGGDQSLVMLYKYKKNYLVRFYIGNESKKKIINEINKSLNIFN
ncbi:PLP-dependent transferase [Candidatus Vidania fulgoroideorum]